MIGVLFVSSLQRPELLQFEPTASATPSAAAGLVMDTVTLDARAGEGWTYFDFGRGAVVDGTVDPDWDIAVQRFHIVTNGGPGYPGEAGAVALPLPFDEVVEAPADGYATTDGRLDDAPANAALERWYRYSFFAHTLEPKDETYALRTADGGYAKLEVISYYCPEATPGCLTFRYAFRPGGGRRLAP